MKYLRQCNRRQKSQDMEYQITDFTLDENIEKSRGGERN